MQFQVDLGLATLRCVQPDEGEDEPYLWTFFFKLDGSTVQQTQPGVFQLIGSVQIAAGNGAHGNLSAKTVESGQTLFIPANVGVHQATLRPIRLEVVGQTIVVPGRLVAFCILMEEDATSDASILKAHGKLRDFLELQWNDFLNNRLNQAAVLTASTEIQEQGTTLTGQALLMAAVERVIEQFVDSLEAPAVTVVEDAVIEDSGVFDLIVNFFDSDNSMGTLQLMFDERQIINSGLQVPIVSPIIRTEDGTWTAYYELRGGLQATLKSTSSDFVSAMAPVGSVAISGGEHDFDRDFVCVPAGTRMQWTIFGSEEEFSIQFTYPFLNVRWNIGGEPLNSPSGTVTFTTSCTFPEFDPTQPPKLIKNRIEQRQVTVRYEIQDLEDEGTLLKLWNHRDDGSYSFIVDVVGLPPGAQEIRLHSEMVTFAGQSIELGPEEFVRAFQECLERIAQVGDDYAKSKRPGLQDLWGTRSRARTYEELIHVVDQLAAVRGVDEVRVAKLKEGIARKLQMKGPQ